MVDQGNGSSGNFFAAKICDLLANTPFNFEINAMFADSYD